MRSDLWDIRDYFYFSLSSWVWLPISWKCRMSMFLLGIKSICLIHFIYFCKEFINQPYILIMSSILGYICGALINSITSLSSQIWICIFIEIIKILFNLAWAHFCVVAMPRAPFEYNIHYISFVYLTPRYIFIFHGGIILW